MKNFIIGLFFGAILLVAAIWYYGGNNPHAERAKQELQNAATHSRDFVADQFGSNNLSVDSIKEELSRTGKVVRRKATEAGSAMADAAADARITTTIKGKLLGDPDLSAISISVSTTAGHVTLSGTVASPELIRRAMQLALDTDGVSEVDSTLQVKK